MSGDQAASREISLARFEGLAEANVTRATPSGPAARVSEVAHLEHNQNRTGFDERLGVRSVPVRVVEGGHSNWKTFPLCRYLKRAEQDGLAHRLITGPPWKLLAGE